MDIQPISFNMGNINSVWSARGSEMVKPTQPVTRRATEPNEEKVSENTFSVDGVARHAASDPGRGLLIDIFA